MYPTTRWLGIGLLSMVVACSGDPVSPRGAGGEPSAPLDAIAIRLDVDLAAGTVRVVPPAPEPDAAPGMSHAILGGNEILATTSNLTRSAPGAFQPGKVRVQFDVALTNRLTSATLVPATLPSGLNNAGLVLFPYRVTRAVGGSAALVLASTDWNGDGSAGSGAPVNFFNDFGCGTAGATSDCLRWKLFPAPLFAGETTPAGRVGFDVPRAISSFTVLLVLAADVSSDLAPVARIVVTPPSYVMADGYTAGFSAVAYDVQNQPLPWATIRWTASDSSAAQFQYGSALVGSIAGPSVVVHGRKVGPVTLYARSGGVSTPVALDVQVNTIVLVQLYTPDSSLTVGDQVQGDARVKDNSGGIVPGILPTWSTSDASVATVDANGLITTVGPGTATITATAAAASGSVTLTVAAPVVTSIVITPPSYIMADGLTASFAAMAYDQSNHAMPAVPILWTAADPTAAEFQYGSALVGSITGPSVVVHGRLDGITTLTASAGGVSQVATLDVQVRTIVLVQVYAADSSLAVGDQQQAQVSVKDNSGQIVAFPVSWSSSDPAVATVDAAGLITAVGVGNADIIATSAAVSGSMPVVVSPSP